jgi:predicted alpha/beta-hydrolase family hydrolase
MALKGKAKTEYQREYMRRRRAGKPRPQPQSTQETDEELDKRILRLHDELRRKKIELRKAEAKRKRRDCNK